MFLASKVKETHWIGLNDLKVGGFGLITKHLKKQEYSKNSVHIHSEYYFFFQNYSYHDAFVYVRMIYCRFLLWKVLAQEEFFTK